MLMEHAKHSTLDGYLACFGEDTMLLQPRSNSLTTYFHEDKFRDQISSEGG